MTRTCIKHHHQYYKWASLLDDVTLDLGDVDLIEYTRMRSKFEELIVLEEDKMYRCTVCERRMSHRGSMKRHLETHLTGLSYDCPNCGKNFRYSNSLNNHKTRYCNKEMQASHNCSSNWERHFQLTKTGKKHHQLSVFLFSKVFITISISMSQKINFAQSTTVTNECC